MIQTMETMSVSTAKAHFNEVNRRVADHHERVSLTTNGVAETVLMAKADLESLEETIAILSDAAAMEGLAQARDELSAGIEATTADEMGDIVNRRRNRLK